MNSREDRCSIEPSLQLVGRVSDDRYLQAVHDVDVQDGFAYAAGKGGQTLYEDGDGTGGTFAVVKVVPPESPTVVGGLDTLTHAQTVRPAGTVCFVADDNGVHAVDVSDPTAPHVEATASAPKLSNVNAMDRWGSYLFTASKGGYVHVIDARRPREIEIVGSFDTGLIAPHDVALVRGHLVLTNYDPDHARYVDPDDERHLSFVRAIESGRLLDPDEWVETASLTEPVLEGSNRLVVRDPYLFVTTYSEDAVVAVEFVDPSGPSVVDALREIGLSVGVALANEYLVQTTTCPPPFDGFEPEVSVIDVADPTAMTVVDSNTHPDADVDFHDGEVRGGYLYLSGQGTNELLIYDVGHARVPGIEAGSIRASSVHAEHGSVLGDARITGGLGVESDWEQAGR